MLRVVQRTLSHIVMCVFVVVVCSHVHNITLRLFVCVCVCRPRACRLTSRVHNVVIIVVINLTLVMCIMTSNVHLRVCRG